VGVSAQCLDELGHLFVALDAAEGSLGVEHARGGPAQHHLPVTHRIAHDAEPTLTHAVPKLSTALIHAYPANNT
jgi:hypothetical protein